VKVIAGMHKCDAGTIMIDDKVVEIDSPSKAQEMGITMIHQELSPIYEMSVAENIFLGREKCKFGLLDSKQLYKQTEELLAQLNIPINPRAKMKHLRVADQQMVEIAKAVSQNAKIVIMDEPTSAITDREVDSLFRMIEDMKKRGTGIIYISHKLDEILRIADEISVLRDGTNVNTWKADEVDNNTIIRSMVGRELKAQFPKMDVPIGEKILEVKGLTRAGQYEDITFTLHRGEILGFVGLVGSGRTELMHSLFGMTKPDTGEIVLRGKTVHFKRPNDAISAGISYVTEDRKGDGLVLPMSVHHNVTLPSLRDFVHVGLLRRKAEDDVVNDEVKALGVRVNNTRQPVKSLSGGNQQKVILAKWMLTKPEIIIFDEPTRGIDVGAKSEIYKIMCEYVAAGNAVIMVSSEMPEAIGMSDRLIVLSNHRCSGQLSREEFSQEAIIRKQFLYM
ncbi:MAG: sugar ABC transporter ATP-binding protein, partial [Clostridia bacterium]